MADPVFVGSIPIREGKHLDMQNRPVFGYLEQRRRLSIGCGDGDEV
jgi:hypothetical protein